MGYDKSYAKYVDHTVLKMPTTLETVKRFCDEAKEYNFACVCVNPCNIAYVAEQLKGTDIHVGACIGFPLGATTTAVKEFETKDAIANGANEIDMVINVGRLKDKNYEYVLNDIKAVVNAAHPRAIVKVIIETCELTDDEKIKACELATEAGADFVKTSTGFGKGGATAHDVRLMKEHIAPNMQVKASTGINSRATCDEMIEAGATRMGTSKGIYIVKDELPNL